MIEAAARGHGAAMHFPNLARAAALVLCLGAGCGSPDSVDSATPSNAGGSGAAAGSGAQPDAGAGARAGSAGAGGNGGQDASDPPPNTGGTGATNTGGTGATNTGGTGATSTGGTGAADAGGGATDAGSTGGTNTGGTGAQPDCTPSDWKSSGKVANPTVQAVAADAGTTHQLYGASKGIAAYDYLEEESFISGTSPAYTSRIVVHRPKNAGRFTGTVFMEWYNVTGGIDIAPLWALSREYMMRAGHVHVGVSAQAVGANALKTYDAERYAAINHPGDTAANAIFAQAAMAIRSQTEKLLGRCMPVRAVIALGQSQSSALLGTYLTSAHPQDQIYDGFMLHSSPFGGPPSGNPDVPVFVIYTMNEANGSVVSQPNLVEWEVAGATHNDAHLMARGEEEQGATTNIRIECSATVNDFPAFWVYNAALDWLEGWVRTGKKPPSGPPLQSATDTYGNRTGGVRSPHIDVPIATYTNANAAKNPLDLLSSFACGLSGSVVPFTSERLLGLYPTHDDYVKKYTQAADKALGAGYLLRADYETAIQKAKAAPIPK